MIHACTERFDVTENFENFLIFVKAYSFVNESTYPSR